MVQKPDREVRVGVRRHDAALDGRPLVLMEQGARLDQSDQGVVVEAVARQRGGQGDGGEVGNGNRARYEEALGVVQATNRGCTLTLGRR